jgi:hypothetical protein
MMRLIYFNGTVYHRARSSVPGLTYVCAFQGFCGTHLVIM